MAGTYAGVETDALSVHAHVAELDELLELDGQRRHDAGIAYNQVVWAVVNSMLLASGAGEEGGRWEDGVNPRSTSD